VKKPPRGALSVEWKHAALSWEGEELSAPALLADDGLEAVACRRYDCDKLSEEGSIEWVDQEVGEEGEEEDALQVDELSDLFSLVEHEEAAGVDFSVFIEDEDALNVEELSEMFSGLEDSKEVEMDVAEVTGADVVDAQNVDALSEMFSGFEDDADAVEVADASFDEAAAVADAANVDLLAEMFSTALEDVDAVEEETPEYSLADCEDAENVTSVAELFTSLEADSETQQEDVNATASTQDWIDALEVDNVAVLFSELEQAEVACHAPPPAVKVDSRVFVPHFAVRIEGQRVAASRSVPTADSRLLAGPPGAFLAGPPALSEHVASREERVGRWKSKRKARSFASKTPDAAISDTRRASAAKRQRVKGRFIRDTSSFVSITALQN
ncbi:hypothetical protein BBJ28_00025098, partial [Nothophytophthora sp. Chile5]